MAPGELWKEITVNPEHQQELEDMVDLMLEEEHPEYMVSPITRWYQFEEALRGLHSPATFDRQYCSECEELIPCQTMILFDEYLEES